MKRRAADSTADRAAVLERRAQRLARRTGAQQREVAHRVALLEVGGECFGIPAEALREIVRMPPITALPGLPEALVGLAQVRGELVAVADLGRLLGIVTEEPATCLAVIAGAPGLLGLQATRALGFRELAADELTVSFAAEHTAEHTAGRPVRGVTRDLITLLDPDRLFASDGIVVRRP